jgi:hypothetical protein
MKSFLLIFLFSSMTCLADDSIRELMRASGRGETLSRAKIIEISKNITNNDIVTVKIYTAQMQDSYAGRLKLEDELSQLNTKIENLKTLRAKVVSGSPQRELLAVLDKELRSANKIFAKKLEEAVTIIVHVEPKELRFEGKDSQRFAKLLEAEQSKGSKVVQILQQKSAPKAPVISRRLIRGSAIFGIIGTATTLGSVAVYKNSKSQQRLNNSDRGINPDKHSPTVIKQPSLYKASQL